MNNGGWSVIAAMAYNRAYGTCVKYGDNYIFIIGGYSNIPIDGVYIHITIIEKRK